ncbi:MAG: hypothetical protein ACI837_000390 [Crocinitomicaceae bacterium]|jgi:hypothetical protein
MHYKIGQKVVFLHEVGGGIVRSELKDGRIAVEDQYGFEHDCLPNEIAPVHGEDYKINSEDIVAINEDESFATIRHQVRQGILTGKRKAIDVWEIDLHIESISDSHNGLSNGEILMKQMRELRTFYQRARSKRIRKIVIIHGVGQGVLKEEVRSFFDRQEGLEYFDADYREYGKGATAVELRYNG